MPWYISRIPSTCPPSDFLQSRLAYLRQLSQIAEGWLSQGPDASGKAPTVEVATQAIALLEALAGQMPVHSGNLLLGPIPAGGIGVDIKTAQGLATIQLYNEARAEIAFEWLDDGQEQELLADAAIAVFRQNLAALG